MSSWFSDDQLSTCYARHSSLAYKCHTPSDELHAQMSLPIQDY